MKHLATNTGALLSIGVAFLYAVNTALYKQASNLGYDEFIIMFSTMLTAWIVLLYVPTVKRQELRQTLISSKVYLASSTLSSFVGIFFNILAVAGTYASYAVSIRRFDSVISVLLGWRYLKETNIKYKILGSAVMTAGAIIMAL